MSKRNKPLNIFLLSQKTLKNAFFTKRVTLLAAHGIDEGFQAQAADIEGLDRVLPKPLFLRSISQLPLLIIGEEG